MNTLPPSDSEWERTLRLARGDAPPPVDESPFAMSLMEKAGLEAKREHKRRAPALPPAAKNPIYAYRC